MDFPFIAYVPSAALDTVLQLPEIFPASADVQDTPERPACLQKGISQATRYRGVLAFEKGECHD